MNLTVRTIVVIALLLGILLPGALIGGYQIYIQRQHSQAQAEAEENRVSDNLVTAIADSLWSFNDQQIRDYVESFAKNPAVIRVVIFRTVNVVNEIPHVSIDHPERRLGASRVLERKLIKDERVFARAVIEFDHQHLVSLTRQRTVESSLLLIAQLTTALGLLLGLAQFGLLRPLQRLSQQATALVRNDTAVPAAIWARRDEINELGRTLNWVREQMAIQLAERTTIERARQAAEARMSIMLRMVPDIFTVSRLADGVIVAVNDGTEIISGWKRDEVIGRRSDDLGLWVDPGDRSRFVDMLQQQHAVADVEYPFRTKDGRIRIGLVSGTTFDVDGVAHMAMTVRDVTALHQHEEALRTSLAAQQAAESANEMKSEFLAMISHEVRTPLGGVIGMLHFGLKDPELTAGTRAKLTVGLSNAEVLLQIINDILDYSKLAAGKMQIETINFNLMTVVHDAQAILRDRAEAKNLSLITDIAPDLPACWRGDPTRLRQVLVNLLGNAIKFTETGEVRLDVTRADDGGIVIAVSDTGIGIGADALARLFQKFEQADASSVRKFGGTGLGLAISKRIVEAMDGHIEVVSEPGAGSTFTLRLPLQPGIETATADSENLAIDTASAPHTHRLRVLCAEDGATNQIIIRELVQTMGHQIEIAEDGVAALAALASQDYDLVLMDSRMPRMNGVTALGLIRQGAEGVRDAAIPVVALTANVGVEERERFISAGAEGFLGKPIDEAALHAEISRMIALLLERGKDLPPRQDGPTADAADIAGLDAMFGIDADGDEHAVEPIVPPQPPSILAAPARQQNDPLHGFSPEARQTLLKVFVAEAPRLLAAVRSGLDAGDAKAIALAAHSLKGSAGYFSAIDLQEICRQIEAAADAGDLVVVTSRIGEFAAAVGVAVERTTSMQQPSIAP